MTITATPTIDTTRTVPTLHDVRTVGDALLEAITEAGPNDPRWAVAGPHVSAAARRLRQALGLPAIDGDVSLAPVVLEADLATAARRLFAKPPLVDDEAARQFLGLAHDATLALR